MNNQDGEQRVAGGSTCYAVIRSGSWRAWYGWPAEIWYATVSAEADIVVGTLVTRPTREWLNHRVAREELSPEQERRLSAAVDPVAAAETLNRAFGQIEVVCPDVTSNLGTLFECAQVQRTWGFADSIVPFRNFDLRVGPHAVMRLIDLVPESLRGESRVRAHAEAYLDLCRARRIIAQVNLASHDPCFAVVTE
jgi:hypothetical protein